MVTGTDEFGETPLFLHELPASVGDAVAGGLPVDLEDRFILEAAERLGLTGLEEMEIRAAAGGL